MNRSIRQDATEALEYMATHIPPSNAVGALTEKGVR
jgi:hypothetical protein